jgi:uridine kinase
MCVGAYVWRLSLQILFSMETFFKKQLEYCHEIILRKRNLLPNNRAALVAISGIDASGKGCVAQQLVDRLHHSAFKTVYINVDSWLNPPAVRFSSDQKAIHFYHQGLRLDDMFRLVIDPLKGYKTVAARVPLIHETDTEFHWEDVFYENVEIIILEGIFLFKQALKKKYDIRIWIECSFDVALDRALKRGQEQLTKEDTIRAYETIYFPAQKIHFDLDDPRDRVDFTFLNDR